VRTNNPGRNTYLWADASWTIQLAEALAIRFSDLSARPALYGLPISLKDCFDLAGTVTHLRHTLLCASQPARGARIQPSPAGCLQQARSSPVKPIFIPWPMASLARIPITATACSQGQPESAHGRFVQRRSGQRTRRIRRRGHWHR